jgi:putative peptide zinc metalloprotease protein
VTLFDPVRNRYVLLEADAVRLLPHWGAISREELQARVQQHTGIEVDLADVDRVAAFLIANHLVQLPRAVLEAGQERMRGVRGGWVRQLLHHYLFLRIPLLRPDPLLERWLPLVRPLVTRTTLTGLVLMAMLALVLVSHQWETFLSTFPDLFSPAGAVGFSIALIVLKSLHELGHGLMARHFGCRVGAMGVALMVLWPVLYTDVSDAWRLPRRRDRLLIGVAGVLTELAVASFALLLWNFLPDGTGRTIAFVIGTTSWLLSLGVNLNPLMRFDGYYLLADLWGIPNLQDRAFQLGRWQLREWLFGFGLPAPEPVPERDRRLLVVYAWCVWIYRLLLFTGIAVLVYYAFAKILGIVLFAIEILYFVLAPIWRECRNWWPDLAAGHASGRASWRTLLALCGILILLFWPWSTYVEAPALLEASRHTTVFAPSPARLESVLVTRGQQVRTGDVLFVLQNPLLQKKLVQARQDLALVRLRLARQASSEEVRRDLPLLLRQQAMDESVVTSLQQELARLTLRARVDGEVLQLGDGLRAGVWVDRTTPLATVVDTSHAEGRMLIPERGFHRLSEQGGGQFYPQDPYRPVVTIQTVRLAPTASRQIPEILGSTHGGTIAARHTDARAIQAETPHHEGRFILSGSTDTIPVRQTMVGTVMLEGQPQSIAGRLFQGVAAVLVRESGF